MFFFSRKMDPIVKLKLKEKGDKVIPVIISLKEPLSNRLKNSISKNGGKIKYHYVHLNSAALQLSITAVDRLSELPEISFISYDRKAEICMDRTTEYMGLNHNNPCNLTGRNITIAVVDTGVFPHGDLTRPYRVVTAFKDFISLYKEPYDDNGHGTHLCGVIAGSGSLSDGRYKGIAQNSRIIMLKAFNNVGAGFISDILAAIDWVIENKESYNIKILCLPFGAQPIVPIMQDPLCSACRLAWNSGLIVVASAGNMGPCSGSIATPGICPDIITVGCCECTSTNIKEWRVPDFSGRGGRTEKQVKPELIAPGVGITSLSSEISFIPSPGRSHKAKAPGILYSSATGTSISAAAAAGCIALLIEKIPDLSGKDLKGILRLSCQTLNEPKSSQGYGVLDLQKLFR